MPFLDPGSMEPEVGALESLQGEARDPPYNAVNRNISAFSHPAPGHNPFTVYGCLPQADGVR